MRLYLRSGGKLKQLRGDADGIARAWAALPAAGSLSLVAEGIGGDMLLLHRSAGGAFRFRVVERTGAAAMGHRVSARRDFDALQAWRLLELYAAGDPDWRTAVVWRRGLFDLPMAILAPGVVIACVAAYFGFASAMGTLQGWSWRYLPNLLVGLAMMGAVFAYVDWFFRRLRRRIADRLGAVFGPSIVQSKEFGFFSRPDLWESAEGGAGSSIKIALLDVLVLMLGLLIPVFAIGTVIVLVARPVLA